MVSKAVCLGDPVVDLLVDLDNAALKALNIVEGGCTTLDSSQLEQLLASLQTIRPPKRWVSGRLLQRM